MSENINTLERDKFAIESSGDVSVKVKPVSGQNNIPIGSDGNRLLVATDFGDNASVDSFGRQRISATEVQFEAHFTDSSKDFLFSDFTDLGGTVTRNSTTADMQITVTNADGSRALRQTKEYLTYTPGQSFLVAMSGNFGAGKVGVQQSIGIFDDDNGIFFRLNGTTLQVIKRSSVSGSAVDTSIDQESFNLDKLDGNGPSGLTLDLTKQQIFLIDFQWLGSGRIRYGFDINGRMVYVHEINNANILATKYSIRASLPLRCELFNTAVTASSTVFNLTCMAALTEGQVKDKVAIRSAVRPAEVSVGTTFFPVLSLRTKSTNIRNTFRLLTLSLVSSSNANFIWSIFFNPTIVGGTWISSGANSIVEYNITATEMAGGDQTFLGFSGARESVAFDIDESLQRIGSTYAGIPDIIVLGVRTLSGSGNIAAALSWEESY